MDPLSHAIMFHHFHDDGHPAGQGSISEVDFELMIDWLASNYSLLSADEYHSKAMNQRLSEDDICLSFDDALLCQYHIAYPVMKKRDLRAYFFVYSSPIMGEINYLEIFRYFRNNFYEDIDDFYGDFFSSVEFLFPGISKKKERLCELAAYLENFPFYTENDKRFRFLRDNILIEEDYRTIMLELMGNKNFDIQEMVPHLWINEEQIKDLYCNGNIIGLHSWSHPTAIEKLSFRTQEKEYRRNLDHLRDLIGDKITSMSHPCGRYGDETLRILTSLGIKVGFRSDMATVRNRSLLEISREDHANIYRTLKG